MFKTINFQHLLPNGQVQLALGQSAFFWANKKTYIIHLPVAIITQLSRLSISTELIIRHCRLKTENTHMYVKNADNRYHCRRFLVIKRHKWKYTVTKQFTLYGDSCRCWHQETWSISLYRQWKFRTPYFLKYKPLCLILVTPKHGQFQSRDNLLKLFSSLINIQSHSRKCIITSNGKTFNYREKSRTISHTIQQTETVSNNEKLSTY